MYRFDVIPVQHLTESEMDCISDKLAQQPMGDMVIDWCRHIQETASNQIEIKIINIKRNGIFLGIGILTIIINLKLTNLLSGPLKKYFTLLDSFRYNPFVFNIGILNIPLIHRPGLLTVPGITPDEYAQIYMEVIRYLRKNRFGMHALCVGSDSTGCVDPLLSQAKLIARAFESRTILDYPYSSFEEYYSTLPGKRRQDIRRSKKALQRYGGRIESCVDFNSVSEEVTKLFRNTADSKSGLNLIHIGHNFFNELSRLKRGLPQLFLVRAENKLVGFSFTFQSGDTLYLKSCGLDYELSLKMDAYFNLYYAAMEYAIKHNLAKIDCGLTTNYFKESKINCQLIPVTYWIDFYHWFFLPVKIIKKIFPALIP